MFENGMLKILKGSLVIFKGNKRNGIYVTKADPVLNHTVGASTVESDAILNDIIDWLI